MNYQAMLITLLSGLSFFIGYFITKFIKNEKKLIVFSVGFSFSIIIGLILFDLLPECLELFNNKILMILSILGGIFLLKLLDLFLPNHSHSKKKSHMEHIGVISAIALFLHNLIEGTAIYSTTITDIKLGIFMMIAVSFHNIPMGIQISSLVHDKKEKTILVSLLSLSSIVGVLILNIFNIEFSNLLIGILMSVSLGMLIYISLFELLCEVKEHIKSKELIYGLILGIIFIILGFFLH